MVLPASITALADTLRTRRDAMTPWVRYTIGLGVHAGSFAGLLTYQFSNPQVSLIAILIGFAVAFTSMAIAMVFFPVDRTHYELALRTELSALVTACMILAGLIWHRPVFAPWIQSLPGVLGVPITLYGAWCVTIVATLPVTAVAEWSAHR